ncbi:ARM repeat-containing protein [Amniculicola lignicola CBS 123094]|uniref:ARM repeat-containing protein n=1 Tax=Amniculicola lignicola CBS 123094 TaxID=1392246 RepID=A0A6A5WQH0_9PLEO|nr:ARM repeat-containing protein [Amniculicola lignicola CBS 123094]
MEKLQTFQRLKSPCVNLIQAVSNLTKEARSKKAIVRALEDLLKTLQDVTSRPDSLDSKSAEFVFVPLSHVLRASGLVPVRALELCLECISILLRTGWKGKVSPQLSGQLLILFTFLANPSSAENGIPATSEELQMRAFMCMAQLLDEISATPKGRISLTESNNIPALGKAVLVMVDSVTDVSSTQVKTQALTAVKALCSGMDDLDALASFLPRMISSLTKILTPSSSNRANFRLLELGLDTMSLLVSRILSDSATKDLPTAGTQKETSGKVVRTASWLQATAAQVKIALANVLKLRNHDKREVRQALLRLCLRVVQGCRNSLADCISMTIETLVTLAGRSGEQDTIESELKALLISESTLSGLLRESLHGWVISLPRLMQSKDDAGRRQIIHQISITLRLLDGEHTDLSMIDDLLAGNLRDSVSRVLSDSKNLNSLVTQPSTAMLHTEMVLGSSRSTTFHILRLPLKSQDDMMEEFGTLLNQLAQSKSSQKVVQDLIITIDSGSPEARLASYWLSVNLLKSMTTHNVAIEDFLDLGTLGLQAELQDELYAISLAKLAQSDFETDSHWHFQALALEVVALQASKYKQDFQVELIEALYPVIHLLGDPNSALRNHAITCLNIIAESCGYANASELVVANVDYIVNAVGLKLNYHDISPQAPQVLLMMMRLCGPRLLPYMDDLIGSMFSALERYHGYPKLVELLFSVLKGMAEEGVKEPLLMITASDDTLHQKLQSRPTTISDVVNMLNTLKREAEKPDAEHIDIGSFPKRPWKDTTKDKPENEEDSDEEAEDTDQRPAEPTTEVSPPVPKTFNVLLKISQLTQHYLTSSSPSLRTSLLSLLHTTIPALAKHEDSFLPLINTLWPVLLPRLEDPEAFVVANALDTVALMCTYAGNFMKSRIEGMWVDLKSIHRRTTTKGVSGRPHNGKMGSGGLNFMQTSEKGIMGAIKEDGVILRPEMYHEAPSKMIWDALVRLLTVVSGHVLVRDEYFDSMLDMLDPVLGQAHVRQALERRNPDAVWLHMIKKDDGELDKMKESLEKLRGQEKVLGQVSSGRVGWNFARLPVPLIEVKSG